MRMVGVAVLSEDRSAEVRAEMDEFGYAVVRHVVPRPSVDRFASEIIGTYERSTKFVGGGTFSGHLNCFPGSSSRFFLDAIEEYGIAGLVRDLRPARHNRIRATLNFNLPGSVAQHCHMDGLYVDDFIICNVGVVPTTIHNGAIELIPGTHSEFRPFWRYAIRRENRNAVRVEMEPGDVLIRRSTLWHRGMPNRSSTPRPMMSLTFGEESAEALDPFAVNDGEIVFYSNWFNPTRLGRLRERTFVKAPISYSAYRFAKSLTGTRGYDRY